MSDTTVQECKCCGFEDDCIEGLCSSCNDFNLNHEKTHKQFLDKPITEHPDVQRLIKQAVLDGFKIKELQAENKKLKEEYGEATDTIQDMIDVLKDTKKRLEKSHCPHAIAAGAWLTEALKGQTND